jgi:hypothetical protein
MNMVLLRLGALLSVLALSGCGGCIGGVSGELNGETVDPVGSGYWFKHDMDSDIVVQVVLRSYPEACETDTEVLDAHLKATEEWGQDLLRNLFNPGEANRRYADALEEIDEEMLPETYWSTRIAFEADDEDEVEGDAFDITRQGTIRICDQEDYNDYQDVFVDDDGSGYKRTCFVGEDGEIRISSFVDRESIAGDGEAEMVEADDQDDSAGDITFGFNVPHCDDYEDVYEDGLAAFLRPDMMNN